MTKKKLIDYDVEKFNEFYDSVSENGVLISFMALFNLENKLIDTSYGEGKNYFDITNLVISLSYNLSAVSYYEMIILNIIRDNEQCEFVIEKNELQNAENIFRNIFYSDDTQENIEDPSLPKVNHEIVRKDIIIFDDFNFEEFKEIILEESMEYCLISQIASINNTISYKVKNENIDSSKNYMVDISNLFSNSIYESLFRIELLLSELMQLDNVNFCIRKEYEKIIKYKLSPLFDNIQYKTNNSEETQMSSKPLTSYTKEDINKMFEQIKKEYFGHTKFIKELEDKIHSFILLNKLDRTKIFSALLCGASGVGKTEIGRLLHKHISPNSNPIKLNFGNYTNQGSLWSLIGSPKGYRGSEEGGELTNKIKSSDSKVILIDEFDRADSDIFNFFYELLEDGSYTDLNGDVIDLTGYIIIFTSNLNQNNYSKVIPESLLSRLDMTVEFNTLNREKINEFIDFIIEDLLNDYKKYIEKSDRDLKPERLDSIKSELLEIETIGETNLRRLKRMLLNKFSEIINIHD